MSEIAAAATEKNQIRRNTNDCATETQTHSLKKIALKSNQILRPKSSIVKEENNKTENRNDQKKIKQVFLICLRRPFSLCQKFLPGRNEIKQKILCFPPRTLHTRCCCVQRKTIVVKCREIVTRDEPIL